MPGFLQKASVTFEGAPLSMLHPEELKMFTSTGSQGISAIIREQLEECLLGILGAEDAMNQSKDLKDLYPNFKTKITREKQTIRLELENAPANAFIDGVLIPIRKRHVAAAFRDLAYQARHFENAYDAPSRSELVEKMMMDAGLRNRQELKIQHELRNAYQVVFQGGHTVGAAEYKYCKLVGEECGLRGWEGISGGGPGTMRGTLRGNEKGFHQLLVKDARQMGFTSPEIIAAEPPNIWVTDLVILPDIEKRLEAFARKMHAIVFLPGGVGTFEELLIQLGMKLDERNGDQHWPMVVTGADGEYAQDINEFVGTVLGEKATRQYHTVINSPKGVAEFVDSHKPDIDFARDLNEDAHEWNRSLFIPEEFQTPFVPSHANMEALELTTNQPIGKLAAELRKLCKGLVYGAVTAEGMANIKEYGKFKIHGDRKILDALDRLLSRFVAKKRIKAEGYEPCYEFVTNGS